MPIKKKGLGKGLDSLIPDNKSIKSVTPDKSAEAKKEAEEKAGVQTMKINEVEPNRDQPRKNFDEDALLELSDSIKQFGVLQPLLVRKRKDYYEIIAGERRWRAAKLAGLKEVPVVIREMTDQEIVEISEKIGTYETSILPFEDCCTIFVAKHPVTKPNLAVIKRHEENLKDCIDEMMQRALDTEELIVVEAQ